MTERDLTMSNAGRCGTCADWDRRPEAKEQMCKSDCRRGSAAIVWIRADFGCPFHRERKLCGTCQCFGDDIWVTDRGVDLHACMHLAVPERAYFVTVDLPACGNHEQVQSQHLCQRCGHTRCGVFNDTLVDFDEDGNVTECNQFCEDDDGWIRVQDRLPQKDNFYWVVKEGRVYRADFRMCGNRWLWGDIARQPMLYVTHWQPYSQPDPPRKDSS